MDEVTNMWSNQMPNNLCNWQVPTPISGWVKWFKLEISRPKVKKVYIITYEVNGGCPQVLQSS